MARIWATSASLISEAERLPSGKARLLVSDVVPDNAFCLAPRQAMRLRPPHVLRPVHRVVGRGCDERRMRAVVMQHGLPPCRADSRGREKWPRRYRTILSGSRPARQSRRAGDVLRQMPRGVGILKPGSRPSQVGVAVLRRPTVEALHDVAKDEKRDRWAVRRIGRGGGSRPAPGHSRRGATRAGLVPASGMCCRPVIHRKTGQQAGAPGPQGTVWVK